MTSLAMIGAITSAATGSALFEHLLELVDVLDVADQL
jgi:hypothetical protein